jgi:hypothetical protein
VTKVITPEFGQDDFSPGLEGVLDVERLGRWVRFTALIEERNVPGYDQPHPVVARLAATDDDGEVVPIGGSEHASIVMLFLQAYYRWRRNARVA